jgi:hypothetical protein
MIDEPYFMEYINKKTDLNEKLNVINIIDYIINNISKFEFQKTEALTILHTKTLSHAQIQYLSIEHLLYIKNNLNTLPFLYLYQPSIYAPKHQLVMITSNSMIDNIEQIFIPLKNKQIIYIKNNELLADNLYEKLLANKLEDINKKLQQEIKQRDALNNKITTLENELKKPNLNQVTRNEKTRQLEKFLKKLEERKQKINTLQHSYDQEAAALKNRREHLQ